MSIIGRINDKVSLDDCVLREEPEVLTRWIDPTIQEKDKEINKLTAESTKWESKYYDMQDNYHNANEEIERLKKIINELEKDMRETVEILKTTEYQKIDIDYVIETLDIYCDRLKKELKEGKDNE